MRMNRGFLGWGVFLLIVGAIPLAVRAGYLTTEAVRDVGNLWPLILIGIGVGILLARTRYAFLGGLLVAATFGVIVGGVLGGGVEGMSAGGCGGGQGTTAFAPREGRFTADAVSVDVQLNCGDLTVTVAPGDTWRVDGHDRDGLGPSIGASNDSLGVRSNDERNGFLDALSDRETWRVTLPDALRFDLDLELNAGSSTLDLGTASLANFNVDLNAGSVTADLSSVRTLDDLDIGLNAGSLELALPNLSVRGSIEANAGSVSLCAPPGAALRLNTNESIVASYDYDGQGLVKNGSTWETPGFDNAAVRIDLGTRANAGSFTLNPEDGCGG